MFIERTTNNLIFIMNKISKDYETKVYLQLQEDGSGGLVDFYTDLYILEWGSAEEMDQVICKRLSIIEDKSKGA